MGMEMAMDRGRFLQREMRKVAFIVLVVMHAIPTGWDDYLVLSQIYAKPDLQIYSR